MSSQLWTRNRAVLPLFHEYLLDHFHYFAKRALCTDHLSEAQSEVFPSVVRSCPGSRAGKVEAKDRTAECPMVSSSLSPCSP